MKTARPLSLRYEHLDFLDELRERGEVNMFGARPFLLEEFEDLSA